MKVETILKDLSESYNNLPIEQTEKHVGTNIIDYKDIEKQSNKKITERLFEHKDELRILSCKNAFRWLNCPYAAIKKENPPRIDKNQRYTYMYFHYALNILLNYEFRDNTTELTDDIIINEYYEIIKTKLNKTFLFFKDTINQIKSNNKDLNYKINIYNKEYKPIKEYTIQWLPIIFSDAPNIIVYNNNFCNIISCKYTNKSYSPKGPEFYLFALCFLSHLKKINKDYKITFSLYQPFPPNIYNAPKDYQFKQSELTYNDVLIWYKANKKAIYTAACGTTLYLKGTWCKFCENRCFPNNKFL